MPIIDELVTVLSFDADTKGGEQFERTMTGVKKGALAAGAALVGLTATVAAFVGRMSGAISETDKFSKSLGISPENLQGLEFAIKRAGGTVGDLRGDLKGLAQTLASPIPGDYNQGLYNLRISAMDAAKGLRGADEVLLDIAEEFEKYGPRERQILATQLGLSEGTIRLVSQGRAKLLAELEKAREKGLILDEEELKLASDYDRRLKDISATLEGIGKRVTISLLRMRAGLVESIGEFLNKNKEIIAQNIAGFFEKTARAARFLVESVKESEVPLEGLLVILGAVVAILSPLLGKLILVAAGIKAAATAWEDFGKFSRGEASATEGIIESISEKFPEMGERIRDAAKALSALLQGGDAGDFLKEFPRLQRIVESLGENIPKIFRNISAAVQDSDRFGDLANSFLGLVDSVLDGIPKMLDAFGRLSTRLKPGLTIAIDFVLGALARLFDFIAAGVRLYTGQFDALSKLLTGDIVGAFRASSEAADNFGRDILDIFGKIFGIGDLSGVISGEKIIQEVSKVGDEVNKFAANLFATVLKNISQAGEEIANSVGQAVKDLVSKVPGAKFLLGNEEESDQQKIARFRAMREAGQLPTGLIGGQGRREPMVVPQMIAAGGQTNNYRNGGTVNQTNNFNISGAGDPSLVASRVAARRDDSFNRALQVAGAGVIE